MSVNFTILGSGSGGNCAYLECENTRLLIDAGFSGRQIRQRLAAIERSPETLSGILITHEHSDHIQGLTALAGRLRIPVYCNRQTREVIESQLNIKMECRLFTTGDSFEIGSIGVDTFSVPHDAQDPVGFSFDANGIRIGFLTDLGHATKLVVERVRASNVLVLETNHDLKMLQEDVRRPWSLKQRILSRHGHLSNDAAADVLEEILTPALTHLYLGHLSRDCNRPEIALGAINMRLKKMGATHLFPVVASQEVACPTLTFNANNPTTDPVHIG